MSVFLLSHFLVFLPCLWLHPSPCCRLLVVPPCLRSLCFLSHLPLTRGTKRRAGRGRDGRQFASAGGEGMWQESDVAVSFVWVSYSSFVLLSCLLLLFFCAAPASLCLPLPPGCFPLHVLLKNSLLFTPERRTKRSAERGRDGRQFSSTGG